MTEGANPPVGETGDFPVLDEERVTDGRENPVTEAVARPES